MGYQSAMSSSDLAPVPGEVGRTSLGPASPAYTGDLSLLRWSLSRRLFSGESVFLWHIMSHWTFKTSKPYGRFVRTLIDACAFFIITVSEHIPENGDLESLPLDVLCEIKIPHMNEIRGYSWYAKGPWGWPLPLSCRDAGWSGWWAAKYSLIVEMNDAHNELYGPPNKFWLSLAFVVTDVYDTNQHVLASFWSRLV